MDKYLYKKYTLFIIIQCILYGLGNPVTKIAYESISPLWLLVTRFSLAGAVYILLFGRGLFRQLRVVRLSCWLPASLCLAACYILGNVALSLTTATNMGFLASLQVLFTPILAWLAHRQGYRWAYVPCQVLVAMGLYLLCCSDGDFSFNLGDGVALLTAVAGAGALVFGARAVRDLDPVAVSACQCLITALISLVLALIFDDFSVLATVKPAAWLVIVYLALPCSVLAYFLQNRALTFLPASLVSLLQCLTPILTALLSWLILGETLSFIGVLGAVIILACIIGQNLLMLKAQGS